MALTTEQETILKEIAAERKKANAIKVLNDAAVEDMKAIRAELTARQAKLTADIAKL